MANDKDFILKNPVEVGGPTNVTLGTVTSNNIDLATGNYFKDTPTGTSTYSISNAGDVQSFQLEVTGGLEAAAETFSTTLYEGTGSNIVINNGIDLAGDGGLVWYRRRDGAENNSIEDTVRGLDKVIYTDSANAQADPGAYGLQAFNSNGFTAGLNTNGGNYVSWTFKKQTNFFDIVTYTGNGTAGRTVSHNLGSVPGMIIVKKTSDTDFWTVYHRGTDATSPEDYWLALSGTGAASSAANMWNGTAPTSTEFTVSAQSNLNGNGSTYVAYLFAHDTDASSLIKCGSFTTDGNGDASVNLGFEPQWVLLKRTDGAQSWWLADTLRGMPVGTSGTAYLNPDQNSAEDSTYTNYINPTATGFAVDAFSGSANYLYTAIRSPFVPTLTYDPDLNWSTGTAPTSPAIGETDVITFSTTDGGTSYQAVQAIDGAK